MITIKLVYTPDSGNGFGARWAVLVDTSGDSGFKHRIYINCKGMATMAGFGYDSVYKTNIHVPEKLASGFCLIVDPYANFVSHDIQLAQTAHTSLVEIINYFGACTLNAKKGGYLKELIFSDLPPTYLTTKVEDTNELMPISGLKWVRAIKTLGHRFEDAVQVSFSALQQVATKNTQFDCQMKIRQDLINFVFTLKVAQPEQNGSVWFGSGRMFGGAPKEFDKYTDWQRHGLAWLNALREVDEYGYYKNTFQEVMQTIVESLTAYPRAIFSTPIDLSLDFDGGKHLLLLKMIEMSAEYNTTGNFGKDIKQLAYNGDSRETNGKPCLISTPSCTAVVKQFVSIVCNSHFCGMNIKVENASVSAAQQGVANTTSYTNGVG